MGFFFFLYLVQGNHHEGLMKSFPLCSLFQGDGNRYTGTEGGRRVWGEVLFREIWKPNNPERGTLLAPQHSPEIVRNEISCLCTDLPAFVLPISSWKTSSPGIGSNFRYFNVSLENEWKAKFSPNKPPFSCRQFCNYWYFREPFSALFYLPVGLLANTLRKKKNGKMGLPISFPKQNTDSNRIAVVCGS